MELYYNYFVDQWLVPTLVIFLFLGSVFAIIVGSALIVRSAAMFRLFGVMNRWVSMRKVMRPVEIPRNADAALHRQRRTLGAVFIVGAALSLIVIIRGFDVAAVVAAFHGGMAPVAIEMTARTAKWVLVAGDVLAIAVGIAMIAIPGALAGFEARANEWYSVRKYDRNVDSMHMDVDTWAQTYPRAFGWSMVLLSLFIFVNLGAVVLSRY